MPEISPIPTAGLRELPRTQVNVLRKLSKELQCVGNDLVLAVFRKQQLDCGKLALMERRGVTLEDIQSWADDLRAHEHAVKVAAEVEHKAVQVSDDDRKAAHEASLAAEREASDRGRRHLAAEREAERHRIHAEEVAREAAAAALRPVNQK
ncbi:hypothetical protein AYO44_03790 [Planctomycetaceae bacterium SCGC AG-212-F19]|nr:hypothetical protein AYO44_03790 [Planctomycetaceae bacterium SCGC AG-212-F19]